MTNATDALRARLQKQCVDWDAYWREPDAHEVILSPEQATELLADALGVEVEITATPAGSASGGDDALDYQMAASAEAAEVDRRGKRIAALQAEVARHKEYAADAAAAKLAAELAQRRTGAEAARLRKLLCRIRDDRSWRTNDNALWQDILAALHQRKENGRAG